MSYLAQSRMTDDPALISRLTACAATKDIPSPRQWVMDNIWSLTASPGWGVAYEQANIEPLEDPASWVPQAGRDPNVITDAMILNSVERVLSLLHGKE